MATLTINNGDNKIDMVLNERTFSTGSKGFGSYGKVEINGKRYQASCTFVEIGSKGAAPVAPAEKAKVIKRKAEVKP